MNLIIVDDNIEFCESMHEFLEQKLKHNVVAMFYSGNDFLNNCTNYPSDIVIMDISMPDMDGYETTKKAFWDNPSMKFVAVTMHNEKAYLQRLIEVGFRGCVLKSNVFSELKIALDQISKGMLYFPSDITLRVRM